VRIESETTQDEVRVSTVIQAGASTVFGILSDPARFSDWIQGEAEFSPAEGSPFQVRFPQFETVISGEVVEIVPNRRMVLSWGVAEGHQSGWFPVGSSRVEIDLQEEDGGTRLTLRHSGLPEKEVPPHQGGWRFHVSRLDLKANRAALEARLPSTFAHWCQAWQEKDADRRGELLNSCTSDQIEYSDEYAQLRGRDQLSLHIGNSLQYVPWTRLEMGPPLICRGEALVEWTLVGDDGAVAEAGSLHCYTDPEGLLTRVTSFWGSTPE